MPGTADGSAPAIVVDELRAGGRQCPSPTSSCGTRPPPVDTAARWWMMQVGMIIGVVTAWPVDGWLRKERMDRRTHLAPLVRRTPRRGPSRGRLTVPGRRAI